jgi:hypothetical protein
METRALRDLELVALQAEEPAAVSSIADLFKISTPNTQGT